jgi:hypothetical protein
VQQVDIKYYTGIVTLCRPDGSGLETLWGQAIISPPYPSRRVLVSTQPPVKRVQETIPGIKAAGTNNKIKNIRNMCRASVTLRRITSLELIL